VVTYGDVSAVRSALQQQVYFWKTSTSRLRMYAETQRNFMKYASNFAQLFIYEKIALALGHFSFLIWEVNGLY
jgi:hypothetical protein